MSTYKNIHGKAIKSVSTNLSDSGAEGQIWFNTTDNNFKSVIKVEAWVSSAPLLQDYRQGGYAGATQSSYMIFGGYPIPTNNTKTFEYNGSGWAAGGNLGTGKYLNGGAGTQTAGLDFGGYNGSAPITIPGGNVTQEYDGSSWSNASAAMGTARYNCLGSGTQTAALSAAGIAAPPANASTANNNFSEEYNGSSWSEGNNLNTPRNTSGSQSGTQTAAIMFGGFAYPSSYKADVENYDGTSWTSGTSLPAGRSRAGTAGTQTDALVFGGNLPPVTDTCFSWDGTTFSAVPALSTARQGGGNSQNAPSTGAVLAGGSPSPKTVTEEFNSSTNVITNAAWSSGGTLGTARYGGGFGMTQDTAAIAGNDQGGSATGKTELYDGTSFTETGDLTQVGYRRALTGTQTAGLAVGAYAAPSIRNWVEEFGGSSWSTGGAFPSVSQFGSAAGPQTAAFYGGQYSASTEDYNEWYDYDGSSWTASTPSSAQYAQQRGLLGNASAQTAAVACGGYDPSNEGTNITESWNGSAWSTGNTVPTDGWAWGYAGTSTAGLIFCNAPGINTNAISWDGTNWTTAPSLSTGRASVQGGAGTSTSAIQMGGNVPPGSYRDATEEFNPGTSTLNVKTLTQS